MKERRRGTSTFKRQNTQTEARFYNTAMNEDAEKSNAFSLIKNYEQESCCENPGTRSLRNSEVAGLCRFEKSTSDNKKEWNLRDHELMRGRKVKSS